ncbi:MAG: universal stress protein [Methanobacterium sp.]|jgi:nucleotide-binding universal stress UspA family protein
MMYKKILLTLDGSENSKRAAEHAINISDINNADIAVLFVVEPYYPRLATLPIDIPKENYYIDIRDEGKKILKDFDNKLEENKSQGKCQNINITCLIKDGKAYIEIFNAMDKENVDLVVMGASGSHNVLDRITLGSVTERVIREARIPVIVIP